MSLYTDLETPVGRAEEPVDLPPHTTAERDVEAMIGHFVDASWAYRFGPPAQDAIVVTLEASGGDSLEPISQSFRFPGGRPMVIESAERLGLEGVRVPDRGGAAIGRAKPPPCLPGAARDPRVYAGRQFLLGGARRWPGDRASTDRVGRGVQRGRPHRAEPRRAPRRALGGANPVTPPARPFYLGTAPDPTFAFFHPSAQEPVSTAVILCSPFGWDDVASYRARRSWAEQLAASGHPTMRFDYPGSGDSGGSPGDPGRVEAAASALGAAAAWLRAETGCSRVAAIGLGLGGLLAAQGIAEGAGIDDLVLWAAPDRGQSFVRQERAFSQMQTSRYSLAGEPEPEVLPSGWMEAGGFVLSAETIAALSRIDLRSFRTGSLSRVLLLDRDGIDIDPRVGEHLGQAGIEVTSGKGDGWAAMCFHPERYQLPVRVIAAVSEWLAAPPPLTHSRPAAEAEPIAPPPAKEFADLEVAGVPVRESAIMLDLPVGPLFAVLAEPVKMPKTGVSGVFLNAGAVRRIGPNRMWVEAARRWAARGIPTLRVDLGGIGDSDGDGMRFATWAPSTRLSWRRRWSPLSTRWCGVTWGVAWCSEGCAPAASGRFTGRPVMPGSGPR